MHSDIVRELAEEVAAKGYIALYGAVLSSVTAIVGVARWVYGLRLRLATAYFWTTQDGGTDEITIANLSVVPINISGYSIVWKRRFMRFDKQPICHADPSERPHSFRIDARSTFSLTFDDPAKFDWSQQTSNGRKLVLTLYVFGRRPKRLVVTRGAWFAS